MVSVPVSQYQLLGIYLILGIQIDVKVQWHRTEQNST